MTEATTLEWIDVGLITDIPKRGSRVVASASGPIAVFRTADDRVFALRDKCPHKGGPLSQGIVHGEHVTCPLHGWNIALATGEAVSPDVGCASRVAVRVEGSRVRIKWSSGAA
jgi:nitrite reductase (NADH) small subunit